MPKYKGNDSDILGVEGLLTRVDTGAQKPGGGGEYLPIIYGLAELLQGFLPILNLLGRPKLAVVWAPILAHHVAAKNVEVYGCVRREVDLATVNAQPLTLRPKALFVVF